MRLPLAVMVALGIGGGFFILACAWYDDILDSRLRRLRCDLAALKEKEEEGWASPWASEVLFAIEDLRRYITGRQILLVPRGTIRSLALDRVIVDPDGRLVGTTNLPVYEVDGLPPGKAFLLKDQFTYVPHVPFFGGDF